jgi:hypothetical protein
MPLLERNSARLTVWCRPKTERHIMELTTGAILRRITETPLSTAAHKLATIILDGIAWKDGYNGLERGTAAFTLAHLAEKMRVSRQHLTALLVELAASSLAVSVRPDRSYRAFHGSSSLIRFILCSAIRASVSASHA